MNITENWKSTGDFWNEIRIIRIIPFLRNIWAIWRWILFWINSLNDFLNSCPILLRVWPNEIELKVGEKAEKIYLIFHFKIGF
jgi:hypothetical protein